MAPVAPTPPSLASTAIMLPAGHAPTFVTGEQVQLRAVATASDGSTSDCTTTAVWSSANEAVAKFSATVPGQMLAVKGGTVSISAGCATGAGTFNVMVGGGVRISGLEAYPDFITPDVHQKLTAMAVSADGTAEADCSSTATWTSSNPAVATFTASTGLNYVGDGSTVISATCGSTTGQITVTYARYQLTGVVRDPTGAPVAGAEVTVMRPYGFDNTEYTKLTTAADGSYSMPSIAVNFSISVKKIGFRTVLNFASWNRKATMAVNADLTIIPIIVQGEGKACRVQPTDPTFAALCGATGALGDYNTSFTVTAPVTLEFHTDWTPTPLMTGHFYTRLYCGNTIVFDRNDQSPNSSGVRVNAVTSCNYRLYMGNRTSVMVVPYRFWVAIP